MGQFDRLTGTGPRSAALDRIAAALEALPASRRSAIEKDVLALERRAAYGGGKRGPRPKLGEAMRAAVLVRCRR